MDELLEHLKPVFLSLQDLDLDAEVADRDLLIEESGHPNGILFGGEDTGNATAHAALQKAVKLTFRVTVMISEALCQIKGDTQLSESLLEAFW